MSRLLKSYIAEMTPAQRAAFAKRAKTTAGHLRQLAGGYRVASSGLAIRIERASEGYVPRESLAEDCAGCDVLRQCRLQQADAKLT